MKKIILLCILFFSIHLGATVYENGENGSSNNWRIYDNTPAGATITNALDNQKGGIISLRGNANAFILGGFNGRVGAWNNTNEKTLKFDIKLYQDYVIYIAVSTTNGSKYIMYNTATRNRGIINNRYIHFGLGRANIDGNWHTITRDLQADLRMYEPNNTITSINGFLVRGSADLDNIELIGDDNPTPPPPSPDNWSIYDNNPAGASIITEFDNIKNKNVVILHGDGRRNGFITGGFSRRAGAWNDRVNNSISWDMRFNENFTFYVTLDTTQGRKFMIYDSSTRNRGSFSNNQYIHIGLGRTNIDGNWHNISRNLNDDLKRYQPNNSIISIDGFLVRGSGKIDNIQRMKSGGEAPNNFTHIKNMIQNNGAATTYICVGDSTRAITDRYEGQYLFYELRNTLSNYGVQSRLFARRGHLVSQFLNGNISPTWRDVTDSIPDNGATTIIDISLGINDMNTGRSVNQTINNLKNAIKNIKNVKPSVNIMLTMPTRINYPGKQWADDMTNKLRNIYISVSKSLNLPLNKVIDELMPTQARTDSSWYRQSDPLHLSRAGQHLVAQYILSNILP